MAEQLQRANCCCTGGKEQPVPASDIPTATNLLDIDWRSGASANPASMEARNR